MLTWLELSWEFDRPFCRADASEIELMVLKILVSSTNVAILQLSQRRKDDSHTKGIVMDRRLTHVALLMLLEAATTLLQKQSFVDIDWSNINQTI